MANVFSNVENVLSGGASGAATSDFAGAVNTLAQTVPPNLANLIPTLQLQVVQGKMTPAEAQAQLQQQSQMLGIKVDPSIEDAQMQALNQMQKIATSGGLTATDKAQLQQIQDSVNSQATGRASAAEQSLAQRGMLNGGLDLAAKLGANQAADEAASKGAAQVASNAQERAISALGQSGQLAGQIQGQQFGEQAQKATAQDAIDQFNTATKNATNEANANRTQAANLTNFNTNNTVAGTNTGIKNTQAELPLQTAITQQNLNETQGKNLADTQIAAGKGQQTAADAQTKQTTAGLGWLTGNDSNGDSNVGNVVSGISDMFSSDPDGKCNVKDMTDDDVENMLSKLSGKTFKYKPGALGGADGKTHAGVMTTDFKKTPLKGNVVETSKGEAVLNNDDMSGALLAAMNNMHTRIKKLEGNK